MLAGVCCIAASPLVRLEIGLEKAQSGIRSKRIIRHQPKNTMYKKDDLVKVANLPGGMKRYKLKGNKAHG